MNVLIINAGSSSLKYQLLDVDTRKVYAKGNCERIGIADSFVTHTEGDGEKQKTPVVMPTHKEAIGWVLENLEKLQKELGIEISGIGHRIVQGGWYFPKSAVVDDAVLAKVREVAPLAPLHNYAEADVIDVCRNRWPEVGNVIVCDTSFHFDMPEEAQHYALPQDVIDELHIRKYGAHGTSHRYIWRAVDMASGHKAHKVVSCHLGSGASLCAIEDGKCMDTTMGLTPLDGLVMGTRCGTIDPATVFYLSREGGYTIDQIDTMMNKKSGLLAVSGGKSDCRDIEQAAAEGDKRSQLAIDVFTYRCASQFMTMVQALQGVDTMVFTAGIGENSSFMRAKVAERLGWLGVKIDDEKNAVRSDDARLISTDDSKIAVYVIPTDEEYMIALDVKELLG